MSFTDVLKDKARAAMVAGDDLQTAVLKATNADPVPPKPKHLLTVLMGVADQGVLQADLFRYIKDRLHNKNWVVRLPVDWKCTRRVAAHFAPAGGRLPSKRSLSSTKSSAPKWTAAHAISHSTRKSSI